MTSDPESNLWRASAGEPITTAALSGDVSADLVVIGGGFTGCSAALEAARAGASVTLLEAKTIGHGGSGRNVGLVNAGLWLTPEQVLRATGETVGTGLLAKLGQGPQTVFDIIAREHIACAATRNGTLHLAHAPAGVKELENRFHQGKGIGAPLQLLDAKETARRTGSAGFYAALFDPRAGTLHPLAYVRGLALAAQRAGAKLYEASAVTSIVHRHDTWELAANGYKLRAKALLLATNAYSAAIGGAARPQYVQVSYSQFATAPLSKAQLGRILPGGEGCWDTALVMSSVRIDAAGRLILGSIGNAEGLGAKIHGNWARRKLRALYPELAQTAFDYRWAGSIAMTRDHVPKVVCFGPNALSVFGYSGRGIAPGTLFGKAAATALLNDTPEVLPLPPINSYCESFTQTRAASYELGATLAHAIRPAPFGFRGQSALPASGPRPSGA